MRTVPIAYLLWFFFGVIGAHRFYCGRIGTGIIWCLTGGLFGIGWLIDVFLIPELVREANAGFLSSRRQYSPVALPPPAHLVEAANAAGTRPLPPGSTGEGLSPGHQVVFCTRCGGPMQVPFGSTGANYACPVCRTVLEIPAFC